MDVQDFFGEKQSTRYRHQCGREYVRSLEATIPRHRLIVCDKCLEPMPLCDHSRASYKYEALPVLGDQIATVAARKTERPVVRTATRPRPFSQNTFQWCIATARQPRRIAFASSTWI